VNTNEGGTSFLREHGTDERRESRGEGKKAATQPTLLGRLARKAKELPALIDAELRENPYRLLGIAVGVGFGAGAVLGSRVGRMLLLTVGEYAVSEALRTQAKRFASELETGL